MARNVIKPVMSANEAVKNVKDGMSVMIGGFNFGGVPYTLVEALEKAGTSGLTMISNDTSYADVGHGRLVAAGQIKKVIASHIGINKKTGEQYNARTGTRSPGNFRRAHPRRRLRAGRIPDAYRRRHQSGGGQASH